MCAAFFCRRTEDAAGSKPAPAPAKVMKSHPKAKVMKSYPKSKPTGLQPKQPAGPPPAKCGGQSSTSQPLPVKAKPAKPIPKKARPVDQPEVKKTLSSGKACPPTPPAWVGPLPEAWWPPPPPSPRKKSDDDDDAGRI